MFSFKPKNTKFYDHFERLAAIIVETAEQVERYFIDFDRRTEYVQKVKELEHQADEVTHQAMALLHKSFITPFDRGDIRRLLMSLDDVIDFMDSAMGRCQIYDVQVNRPAAREIAGVLVKIGEAVQQAVGSLRNLHNSEAILQHCIEINRLENESDSIHHAFLAELFKTESNPLDVIKWKEICGHLEESVDRCEDVANVIEGIVLENA